MFRSQYSKKRKFWYLNRSFKRVCKTFDWRYLSKFEIWIYVSSHRLDFVDGPEFFHSFNHIPAPVGVHCTLWDVYPCCWDKLIQFAYLALAPVHNISLSILCLFCWSLMLCRTVMLSVSCCPFCNDVSNIFLCNVRCDRSISSLSCLHNMFLIKRFSLCPTDSVSFGSSTFRFKCQQLFSDSIVVHPCLLSFPLFLALWQLTL